MKKEKEITQEDIEKKVDKLFEMIMKFKGCKSDAAYYACYQVVCAAAYNHYEGLGILQEVLLSWRESSAEVCKEENKE